MGAQSAVYFDMDRMPNYQLDVIGLDVADVVCSAGGWLCDRVLAGWDVRVTLTDDGDPRPLRILGLGCGERRSEPVALAVAGTLSGHALRLGHAEVTVWGADRLTGLQPVRHVVSAAARAFKAHALVAAGLDGVAARPVEVFHRRG